MLKPDAATVYLRLYVDDMLIAAKNVAMIKEIKSQLQEHFQMKERGAAKFVLGMEISQDQAARVTTVKQTQYIRDITERFNETVAKAVDNPCNTSFKTSLHDTPSAQNKRDALQNKPYRSLIGCLLYVSTSTSLDISFSGGHLSRYVENPGEAQLEGGNPCTEVPLDHSQLRNQVC